MRRFLAIALTAALLLPSICLAADVLQVDKEKYLNKPSFVGYVPDRFIVVLKDNVPVDHVKELQTQFALSDKLGFAALAKQFGVTNSRPQFPGSDRNQVAATKSAKALARHYKVHVDPEQIESAVAAYEANRWLYLRSVALF
jgi:hypothetical protein